ncbi:two-partner secretion domain-containing protein [Mastigocoleus testarum]|uniref:Filamentous haemagglutinin FhaB/tRNA nuclease CdiA-like TPS domain-containing protein n=1 Tax=Mastigocoleus testarum BC008 TaxID=371196 RepID=A0A0V7ZMI7_9CYAN|nr:filamentous hemagglutinin N-terminal domain-containing protein [Mastigocoleus testarum]KST65740.1 hypothetical protein BC008_22435 [Mastigocoleus testarum BC008]
MYNRFCFLWGLSLTLSLASVVRVQAQLIPDNTLGKENSIVTPIDSLENRIDGGAIRGSNLFHSFQEFNIDNNQSVYFNNPGVIANILTRVTGTNPSSILGKLGVLGDANLFLINPNGIIFGKGASLDISGSFTASTVPNILFDNGWEFSATNPLAPPLLELDITPGLQYPRNQLQHTTLQDITSEGNLTVGEDLNFVGRNLNLTGQLNAGRDLNLKAQNNLQIRDTPVEDPQNQDSNSPFIASAGNNLLLQGNQTIDIFALNHPDSGLFSGNDLLLQSSTAVLGDARYFSGGDFRIEDSDESLGNLNSFNDTMIRASGDVSFDSYTGASLHILAGGSVNITGDVTITDADGENGLEETITLSSGESLEIDGTNQATLDIRAGTTAFANPGVTGSEDFTSLNPNLEGIYGNSDIFIGGNIRVGEKNGLVFLTNQYSIDSSLNRGYIQVEGNIDTSSISGNGGKIIFDSRGDINTKFVSSASSSQQENSDGGLIKFIAIGNINPGELDAGSSFGRGGEISLAAVENISFNATSANTTGNKGSGDIDIKTGSLIMTNGARLSASTFGEGDAGTIIINATDHIKFDGDSGAFSKVNSGAVGNAGGISVTSGSLEMSNFSQFYSPSLGQGDAGKIDINVTDSLKLHRARLSTSTLGKGDAGTIIINASSIFLSLSGVFSQVNSGGVGNAGGISVTTRSLDVTDGAQIATSIEGKGNAGRVDIIATDYAKFDGRISLGNSGVYSRVKSGAVGNGGGISITTGSLYVTNYAQLNASTNGKGDAGSIIINVSDSVQFAGESRLSVKANNGETAGSATVNTSQLSVTDGAQINVSSPLGQAGNLEITADNLFLNRGTLTAETGVGESSEGANITLTIKDLLWMKNNSLISAEAFDTANGGNITINNPKGFVIGLPFENSDITANANKGKGGNIDITTQNIFGLVFREQKTPKSDITASSQFGVNGQVTVNQLNINPASGLVELPSNLEETTKIKAGCSAYAGNKFIVAGKGGLPQSPNDLFTGKTTHTELFDLVLSNSQAEANVYSLNSNLSVDKEKNQVQNQNQNQNQNQIVEATGLIVDADGNMALVAKTPEVDSQYSGIPSLSCDNFSAFIK